MYKAVRRSASQRLFRTETAANDACAVYLVGDGANASVDGIDETEGNARSSQSCSHFTAPAVRTEE